ncbi:hypothetical protein [Cryobacterium sp. PH29-G1]|uniref:hypothetical protein n=1 Tax=Cryobacterium sp. PH29-G1 TaxID=3046211 RepID=UPI0024B8F8DD|nr:hypothetical protein [Cryobacterium sp. PH29-G1]MDJ0349000.1 hypothetical protein [Cryobacterium sp. PH29-G1]
MTQPPVSPPAAPELDSPRTGIAPTLRRASLEGIAVSSAVALTWALMATTHPTTTYHFAPLITVAAAALYVRARRERPLTFRPMLSLAAGGTLISMFATAVLENVQALQGPTLWGPGSAVAETVAAIAIGLLLSLTAMIGPRRRATHS